MSLKKCQNLISVNRDSLSKSYMYLKYDDKITINFIKLEKLGESKEMLLKLS